MHPHWVLHVAARIVAVALPVLTGQKIFYADVEAYFQTAGRLAADHLPYRDFVWEFPPGTIPVLGLLPLSHYNLVRFSVAFVAVMIAFEVGSMYKLRRLAGEQGHLVEWFWLVVAVPLGALAYFRLDFISVFFAAWALGALCDPLKRGWAVVGGVAAKLWPIVFTVPLLVQRRYDAVAAILSASAALGGAWYLFSPQSFLDFFDYGRGKGFQVESLPGAALLMLGNKPEFSFGAWNVSAGSLGLLEAALPCAFVLGAAVLTIWGWRQSLNLVALAGVLTLLLLVTSRVLSAQYLLWLAPFGALLFAKFRVQGYLLAGATALTLLMLVYYRALLEGSQWLPILLNVRNVLLLVLLVEWLRVTAKGPILLNEGR